MAGQNQTSLRNLCIRKLWPMPVYNLVAATGGYLYNVVILGHAIVGDIHDTDFEAREAAASNALLLYGDRL
ncbi:hypothetical protein OnM2_016002 [Erysiphe neolycopersici]|uniref:DRBM domain-containing protein n=1 Tax=Erysiphe neolycopersici TaxID=212602 RepID=A0A420I503_9PEZI|nr:hypothetical protein OnM2_016002 [Erysiphe neolycopersici]